jgi:hypothetical protein
MRNDILDYIRKELIGPDPVKPHIQQNGEEILLNEPPRIRYGAGILFPSPNKEGEGVIYSSVDSIDAEEDEVIKSNIEEISDEILETISDNNTSSNVGDDFEEEIGLANNFLPSAMGFSCFSKIPKEGFTLKVNFAVYEINNYSYMKEDGSQVERKAYFRTPLDQTLFIPASDIPNVSGTSKEFSLKGQDQNKIKLKLNIRNRTHKIDSDITNHLLTFTLINRNTASKENIRNEDCFFQVSFSVSSDENCFFPYKIAASKTDQEDEKSNQLLFRKKKTFAVGHGCSPAWIDDDTESVNKITTEAIPSYEIKPIVPNELKSVALTMFDMCDLTNDDITSNLVKLNSKYEEWITEQERNAINELSGEFLATAWRHIESCRVCLKRMQEGVELLKNDKKVIRAFKLMNRAMLLQQLHYGIDTRNWIVEKGNITGLEDTRIPDIKDQSTWPRNVDGSLKVGSWRPFQIAFILINLNSMLDAHHSDRQMVDLIWFPTGGGKTEAYLGLSAFTIFLKRLKDQTDFGTTVLMRYTLRLLTAQQFQRAAALICACEKIRDENKNELGTDRITIGLWVGELTPNKRADATKVLKKMSQGKEDDNPFVVLKCPWCGSQMGPIKGTKKDEIKGYKLRKVNNHETVVFKCDNNRCDFSDEKFSLPLLVIDEDIYDNAPTLLIGTVDKFAMLTWRPEARTLFGFTDKGRLSPPELIIQDELHLISGPLGSMVGLYETMIEEFCTKDNIKPKIIASSATISRAKEQINSLYGRGTKNVNIFPAQCLSAGDSFFAYEEKDPNNSPGRLYVGVFASALPSHATAQVRVLSSLLQSVKSIPVTNEKDRDSYWTALTYFNSIRELGHAATLIRADISEYLNSIYIRKKITGTERRFINVDRELTSRINSSQITEILEELLLEYPKEKYPIDVCLATNMISVGVDIPRLGLMTVIGQPKTTSEYIQATSRVGRSKKGPGIIFTVYNCSKPRDRSHFEHFQEYHSKIYSKVEPTSVTPFSPPARERALHAILVGLIRFYSEANRDFPNPFPTPEMIEKVKDIIQKRVTEIDKDEVIKTMEMLNDRIKKWRDSPPIIYGSFSPSDNIPLMYPAGSNPPDNIKLRAWSTPSTMRNVDSTCDAIVINEYINIDNLEA